MTVPVIDISGDPRKVAAEVGAACGELGFLTVVGHGVPDDVAERAASATHAFFDLPEAGETARWPTASRSSASPRTGRCAAKASPPASGRRRPAT